MLLTFNLGIIAGFIAFLMWGFGDFFIQRSVKKVGALAALFWISLTGGVALLPWVVKDLPQILANQQLLNLLLVTSVISYAAGALFLKSLAVGKISVIEAIMSFEVIATALIGIFILKEKVVPLQMILILSVVLGIIMAIKKAPPRYFWQRWFFKRRLEKGAIIAFVSVLIISLMNIFVGLSSQNTNPLLAIWFIHFFIALILLLWFIIKKQTHQLFQESFKNWRLLLITSVLDITAWLAYAFATTKIPISITIAITESYIALAVILGIFINKEKLSKHQLIGIAITLLAAIALAVISN